MKKVPMIVNINHGGLGRKFTYKRSYQNPDCKHRSSFCSSHPVPFADLPRSAGSEPTLSGGGNGLGRKRPGLLQDGECCRKWCGLSALLLFCKDDLVFSVLYPSRIMERKDLKL